MKNEARVLLDWLRNTPAEKIVTKQFGYGYGDDFCDDNAERLRNYLIDNRPEPVPAPSLQDAKYLRGSDDVWYPHIHSDNLSRAASRRFGDFAAADTLRRTLCGLAKAAIAPEHKLETVLGIVAHEYRGDVWQRGPDNLWHRLPGELPARLTYDEAVAIWKDGNW